MASYNLQHLIKINVFDATPSTWFKYKKEIKILWFIIRDSGIYDRLGNWFSDENMENRFTINHFLKDNIVFEKSECKLFFNNDVCFSFFFNTPEEAMQKAEEIKLKSGIWIEIS